MLSFNIHLLVDHRKKTGKNFNYVTSYQLKISTYVYSYAYEFAFMGIYNRKLEPSHNYKIVII